MPQSNQRTHNDTCQRLRHQRVLSASYVEPKFTSPEDEKRLAEEAKTFPVTKLPYRGPRGRRK